MPPSIPQKIIQPVNDNKLLKLSHFTEEAFQMTQNRDRYVSVCPYCGGTEFIESLQDGYGAISAVKNWFHGCALYHSICRKCGSVVRSYVKEPEKLLKRKDRRER